MPRYQHLSDAALAHGFDSAFSREDAATADVLEYIAEFDERKLYVPAGYPSLLDYCVGKQRRSRDAARKRIHAAHTARRFPVIFDLVQQGRLHLSAVVMLAPYLTSDNVDDLLTAAACKSKDEIRQILHHRFSQPNHPSLVDSSETSPGSAAEPETSDPTVPPTPQPMVPCAPGRMEATQVLVAPQSVQLDQEMAELVGRAQALLGYELRSDDPKEVIRRSLRVLIGQLEKKKCRRPRLVTPPTNTNPRHISNAVMSAVWKRDCGACTFEGENGHRCGSRRHVQFDHIVPVARGGESTISNLRLRCRAHNQFEADRVFGSEFMQQKRCNTERVSADLDVVPWLRQLGYRADQAKRAAAHCETLPAASLEERVRAALQFLAPPHRKIPASLEANG